MFQLAQAGVHIFGESLPRTSPGLAEQDGAGHHEVFLPVRVGSVCLFVRPQPTSVVLRRHGEEKVRFRLGSDDERDEERDEKRNISRPGVPCVEEIFQVRTPFLCFILS